MRKKYVDQENKRGVSNLWRTIQDQKKYINHAMIWALGNGNKIKFWLDSCISLGNNLLDVANSYIP